MKKDIPELAFATVFFTGLMMVPMMAIKAIKNNERAR